MSEPVELRFLGFEPRDAWTLRAAFDVLDSDGRRFTAHADVSAGGRLLDLQADDVPACGTTGRPTIDALLARRVEAELIRARSVAVVANFDRRRQSRHGRAA